MKMKHKNNKKAYIKTLITLVFVLAFICTSVTGVYADTVTKTYGTDAFGETNGYLRISQGTIKSCKYSVNGATATTVTGDNRFAAYYTDDGTKVHRTYTGDSTYYEYVITNGYVYDGELGECTVRIEYNGSSSGLARFEAGFEEETANNGNPAGITGDQGSTVKVTITGLPSDFKGVMEVTDLDTSEGWKLGSSYRAQDSIWIPSGASSCVSVSTDGKVLGLHETNASATDQCNETGKHQAFLYFKADSSGKIVLYYFPGSTNHASHIAGVSGSKVVYNANGKTASNMPETDYSAWMSKYKITSKKPTATGYVFSKWNTKANGSGTTYNPKDYIASLPSGTTTLYAQWTANTGTIRYFPNGGTVTTDKGYTIHSTGKYMLNSDGTTKTVTFNYDRSSNIDLNNMGGTFGVTKTGYHLKDGAEYKVGSSSSTVTVDHDDASISTLKKQIESGDATINLYANWEANTYTVNYNGNGNTSGSTASSSHTYDIAKNLTANGYVKTGYKFNGWNTKADGSGTSYSDKASVKNLTATNNGTVTLYAQWEANTLTVTYDANGGSINTASENYAHDITTFKHNWKYTTSAQDPYNFGTFGLYRTGYHRRDGAEWNTAANGSGTAFDQDVEYTMLTYAPNLGSGNQSIVLYAQWDINQSTLTVNPNGGTWGGKTSSQSFTQNYNTTLTIPNPTVSNYTITFNANEGACATSSLTTNKAFSSWTKSSGFNAGSLSGTTFTFGTANGGTGTLTASWSGSHSITLPTPSRIGYTFEGWYKESSLTNKAGDAGASYTATATTTLYAKWKPIPYKQIVQVRYQNVDGTWGDYSNVINANYDYDSTVSWSVAQTWSHKAASVSYKVTGEKTTKVDIARRTYTLKFVKGDTNISSIPADQSCLAGNDLSATCTSKTGYHLTKYTGTKYDGSGTDTWTECNEKTSDTSSWTMHADRTITVYSTANTYYVSYVKGLTNNGGTTSASTHTYDANVTLHVNSFTGTSYSLTFNANKPKDDKGNVTVGTVSNLQSNKVGTLQFKNWYITDAHNNNNTNASAGTNLGKKNYRNDHKGTATATAQWNSVILKDYSEPSLKGYKFNGYFTSATGGTKTTTITVDPSTTAYSNTLYAQWTPITYTIRFNGNNNWNTSQGSYTQTITYDKHTALTPNKFTRPDNTTYNGVLYKAGYEFVGWGTSPTQTTPTYTNEQEVYNLTATDGEVIDLYAIWKKTVTLTIDFNDGKFNNSTDSKVFSYTMYNSELNHTFDIEQYYGTQIGTGYYDKGLNLSCIKNVDDVSYRFLGYSLTQTSKVPDTQFDTFAYTTRTEAYNIRDNTTLYAIWEPILQMTASLSTSEGHSVPIQLTNAITIHNALGNFVIPSGTTNTALPNTAIAYTKNEFARINTVNSATVSYTVNAKGNDNIKFGMTIDDRILDIYTNGKDNTWYDELNQLTDFDYKIVDFTTITDDFIIPKYLGTTNSYKTSNPNSADNYIVYGIKFTCTQPSYYYEKYWKTDETISIYGIIFLEPTEISDSEGEGGLPEHGDFDFQTILN